MPLRRHHPLFNNGGAASVHLIVTKSSRNPPTGELHSSLARSNNINYIERAQSRATFPTLPGLRDCYARDAIWRIDSIPACAKFESSQ